MISVWRCHYCVNTKTVTLLGLRVISKLLLVCTNSLYQLESGTAQTWTCCRLLLPDTAAVLVPLTLTHANANVDTHTATQTHNERAYTAHAHTHFRCGYFGMQGAEWECSLALTGETVWQAKNKTRKWGLEMCLSFSLTFLLGSLYNGPINITWESYI